jgi:hypothetical protein
MKGTKALTQAERTQRHRDRKREEGWRLVQVYLEPRSSAILETVKERHDMTTAQAMNHIIQDIS